MGKAVKLCVVFLLALSLEAGCASHTKTVRTQTTQDSAGLVSNSEPTVAEEQTTTTKETEGGSSSLLTLPFRAIGGLISFILF